MTEAFLKREKLFRDPETNAYRLFNGFCEGLPEISADRYGNTVVLHWMDRKNPPVQQTVREIAELCLEIIPDLSSVLFKNRYAQTDQEKRGILLYGEHTADSVREWGVAYPVNLRINKDCGFYLDSSLLRKWLIENAGGKRVLNTFAYTGSLGDAASAGGALSVTQTDLNHNYLSARNSGQEYIFGDFFHVTASMRRADRLFDLIVLDPPFFANAGRSAKVDQARNAAALINKIRPLAAHHGKIIVVNNALFLSGKEFLHQLTPLCGECLSIGEIIPVPDSFIGFTPLTKEKLPADPSPFNHPTKMIILDILRKDGRK